MEAKFHQIALLDSVIYRPGTKIDTSQFTENLSIYNHSTGLIAYVDLDGIARLEGGGVYTLEPTSSALVQESMRQPTPSGSLSEINFQV